ncbi:MAG: hypothetical protein MUF45_15305 [Spirosomaceae bacterium]|nr:hypothetical protein [Spirosomataceae bacterium]
MKKHPIDDLFASKMAEYRQEPSQKAFEKFQARLAEREEKKRGGGFLSLSRNMWYYGAAAGVVVALAVALLNQGGGHSGNDVLADKNKPSKAVETPKSVESAEQSRFVLTNPQKNIEDKSVEPKAVIVKKVLPHVVEETGQIAQNEIAPKPTEFVNPILDNTIDSHGEVIASTIDNTSEISKNDIGNLQTLESKEIVLVLSATPQTSDYIPQVDADSNTEFEQIRRLAMEREESSKSFLARLTEEYKNFKYGEKVDLENLKLNPKAVLARADEEFLREERNDIKSVFQRKIGRFLK